MGTELRMSPSLLETFAIQLQLRYFCHLAFVRIVLFTSPFLGRIPELQLQGQKSPCLEESKVFWGWSQNGWCWLIARGSRGSLVYISAFLRRVWGYKLNIFWTWRYMKYSGIQWHFLRAEYPSAIKSLPWPQWAWRFRWPQRSLMRTTRPLIYMLQRSLAQPQLVSPEWIQPKQNYFSRQHFF